MATLNLQVGASSDDVLRRLTSAYWWGLNYAALIAGAYAADNRKFGSGMRFTNITIPPGSVITTAYLTLRCSQTRSGTPANTRISAEKHDSAPTFADDAAAFDARWANRTTARVDWDGIPAWTVDIDYTSPEIKTVVQEIVNRAGWASGNAAVIFWEDFDDRSGTDLCDKQCYAYDGSITYAPKLVIEYAPPQTLSPSGIAQAADLGTPQLNLILYPSGIEQLVALGTPTVTLMLQFISPSGISQAIVIGTPTLIYPQTLSPQGIAQAIVFGTPSVGVQGLIRPVGIEQLIAFGNPTITKYVWHVILDGQYITESPGLNKAYVIGRDDNGINVYGSSEDSAELALLGERLDFALELEIPTTALAADVAAAILAKHRLGKARGFLVVPPNCGVELWDVVEVTDTPANQAAVKYRITAIRFEYHPKLAKYGHKLTLGAT